MTARKIQQLVPSNFYVIATDGFIWEPDYDSRKRILKKSAIPDKLDLRKEIKQQSALASKIIIATDNDPSGDFIAWSLAKYLPGKQLFRSVLQSITKSGILRLTQNAVEFDQSKLLYKLENRFFIQQVWKQRFPGYSMKEAATIALKAHQTYSTFRTENGNVFKTNKPVSCSIGDKLILQQSPDKIEYLNKLPLSTFDVVTDIFRVLDLNSYFEAQDILNQLFHKTYPDSGESLISYPRTAAQAYYRNSWQRLQDQWVHFESLDSFRPNFMQSVIDNAEAHESIHPYDLRISPQMVSKRVQKPFSEVYKIIYDETIEAISQPEKAVSNYYSNQTDQLFYSNDPLTDSTVEVTSVFTIAEWGRHLYNLGVLRPSGFGAWIDEAIKTGLISIEDGCVLPETLSTADHQKAENFKYLLEELRAVSDKPDLSDETLSEIFACKL